MELHTELSIGSYSHFNTDSHMYSGIGTNAEPKKEIRIELQVLTDSYTTIGTILLRFLGARWGESGGETTHGYSRDSGRRCVLHLRWAHAPSARRLYDLLLPLHCHKPQHDRRLTQPQGTTITFVDGSGTGYQIGRFCGWWRPKKKLPSANPYATPGHKYPQPKSVMPSRK